MTNGLRAKRASCEASRRTTGPALRTVTAHIESSRRQTDGSKPTVATWCCSVSVMMLTVALGTSAIRAASSTTASSSPRGGIRTASYALIAATRRWSSTPVAITGSG